MAPPSTGMTGYRSRTRKQSRTATSLHPDRGKYGNCGDVSGRKETETAETAKKDEPTYPSTTA